MGSFVINKVGFRHNGWGIASTLYAMFSEEDGSDYFSNARALNVLAINPKSPNAEMAHVSNVGMLLLLMDVRPKVIVEHFSLLFAFYHSRSILYGRPRGRLPLGFETLGPLCRHSLSWRFKS